MIDPSLFTAETLLKVVLEARDTPWLNEITIIPKYMPPYPRPDTRPSCVVSYPFTDPRDGEQDQCFLRRKFKGHFWDIYGDDYLTPERALLAILEAPPPPPITGSYLVHKFRIPLGNKA